MVLPLEGLLRFIFTFL